LVGCQHGNSSSLRNQAFAEVIFCCFLHFQSKTCKNIFKAKRAMSGAKSTFSFVQTKSTGIWKRFIMLVIECIDAVRKLNTKSFCLCEHYFHFWKKINKLSTYTKSYSVLKKSKRKIKTHLLKQPFKLASAFSSFFIATPVNAMLYQVS